MYTAGLVGSILVITMHNNIILIYYSIIYYYFIHIAKYYQNA